MTPEQKAQEIYDKMDAEVRKTAFDSYYDNRVSTDCALIAVEEIIGCYNWPIANLRYWQNVRDEIKKL